MAKLKKLGSKTRLALIFSVVTILMLLLVTPGYATNVTIGGPSAVYQGANLDFWVQIDIYSCEQIPIDFICVDVSGAGSAYVKFNPNGTITDQSGGFTMLSASFPAPGQGFTYCYENWGYGYIHGGYSPYGYCCPHPEDWGYDYVPREIAEEAKHGYDIHFGPGFGYGYGQEGYEGGCYPEPGVVSLRYNIRLNTAGMPYGAYHACASTGTPEYNKWFFLNSVDEVPPFALSSCCIGFTSVPGYQFVIGAAGAPGGGGPGEPTTYYATSGADPCCLELSPLLGPDGRLSRPVELNCTACEFILYLPAGTLMLGPDGHPLAEICFELLSTPPVPEGWAMVGRAIDYKPDGSTFDPAITMTIDYDPADVPEGASESDIVLAYYDGAKWVHLETTIDTAANTATAAISHFTSFALLVELPAPPPPAPPPPPPPPAPEPAPAPPAPAPPPPPPPAPPAPIAWWIWVIVGVVVVGVVVWVVMRRRRA